MLKSYKQPIDWQFEGLHLIHSSTIGGIMVNIDECNCRQLFGQYCNVAQANMMYNLYLYRLTTCYFQIFAKAVVLATI